MTFDPGIRVRHFDNPGRQGTVLNGERCNTYGISRKIRWDDGNTDFVSEDQLEILEENAMSDPYALIREGKYARSEDFRRNLTYVHLSGRLANLVYSMGITNTDFYPHQYRPLLTFLDSAVNGLLIADEVGLGKTIEAGLIWTELRARYDMRRLLVVCPAMLCEKWYYELSNRFGVDASIVNAKELLRIVKQPSIQLGEGKAWIISYNGLRPPREWKEEITDENQKDKEKKASCQLCNIFRKKANSEPVFDLVIYDEAHFMRNKGTATWRLGNLLREVAEYQIMLSATPINLHNEDLFNLLQLLDEDHFRWLSDFEKLIDANTYLIKARDTVLDRQSSILDIKEILQKAANTPILSNYKQLTKITEEHFNNTELSDKLRAHIASVLERMNLLSYIVTRTRKRDVLTKRILREVHRESVPMTQLEYELYIEVTRAVIKYASSKGILPGFLFVTPQRLVTSCPAAMLEAWLTEDGDEGDWESAEGYEDTANESNKENNRPLREFISDEISSKFNFEELKNNDSKFNRLNEIAVRFIEENPDEKVIIFTAFRATAKYLCERLSRVGIGSKLLLGGLRQSKQEVINEFRENNNLRFLVSTEVASVGVDLQFCRFLINYDLPWNPTRIEQRIGRIDRLGQNADKIHIWNLYFKNTIDDRIVERLLDRIRIFDEALGLSEAIIGEHIQKLEYSLLTRTLSPEQIDREIDRAFLAIENALRNRDQLQKNAPHMMAHGQHVIEQIEAANELSRRVTEHDLYIYVHDYLTRFGSGSRFIQECNDQYAVSIQLSNTLAASLDDFCKRKGISGKTALGKGEPKCCRFLNKISQIPKRGEEIIHQFHPLIRFIAYDIKTRKEQLYPVVAIQIRAADLNNKYRSGVYTFIIRLWVFNGVHEEEFLAVQAYSLSQHEALSVEESESLIQVARNFGFDWLAPSQDPEEIIKALDNCENGLQKRYNERKKQKELENDDRVRFQIDAIERHLQSVIPKKNEIIRKHEDAGITSLAKAVQGQIDKLVARMNVKKETIKRKGVIMPETNFVCLGLIKVL